MKTILTATAISALMIGGALAQSTENILVGCLAPGLCAAAKGTAYYDANGNLIDGNDSTMDYLSFPGVAATGTAPKPAMEDHDNDPATPDVPVMIDHDNDPTTPSVQAYVQQAPTAGVNARVHGHQSAALGAGSRVGAFVYDGTTGDQVFITNQNYNGTCSINGQDSFCRDLEGNKIPATTAVQNGTALGANSQVSHDNSTVVGAGAKSTDANQVTLGTKDETVRAEGITSQKSKDRQVGPTELVTSDSGGRLATDGGQTFARIGSLENYVTAQGAAINANTALLSQHSAALDEHAKGLAISMAMPDAWLSDKKKFGIFGGIGGFEGETALGLAAIGRLDETFSLNAKIGADTDFDHVGWQVGIGAQW